MLLNKVNYINQSLIEKDGKITFEGLDCWSKEETGYSIYIFSIQLENQSELLEVHQDIRDYIAIYFQSQFLEKNVERWNIYQFYFIKDKIDESTKQLIEQDKFSTRKIIHDGINKELSDDEIISLVNKELFEFNISNRVLPNESADDFLIAKGHNKILSLLNQNLTLEQLIENLGHE